LISPLRNQAALSDQNETTVLISLILAFSILTGCVSNSLSPSPFELTDNCILFEVNSDSLTSVGGEFLLTNKTDSPYGYGEKYCLEKILIGTGSLWIILKMQSRSGMMFYF